VEIDEKEPLEVRLSVDESKRAEDGLESASAGCLGDFLSLALSLEASSVAMVRPAAISYWKIGEEEEH
jgi:hypothetical protein